MIALAPARKPVAPDPTEHLTSVVSASRLNCFHNCRLKFYFRYVLELVKPSTAALFVGKAVHAALQQWSTARWRGQPHDAESLKAGFMMNWITGQEDAPVKWEDDEDAQRENTIVPIAARSISGVGGMPPPKSLPIVSSKTTPFSALAFTASKLREFSFRSVTASP